MKWTSRGGGGDGCDPSIGGLTGIIGTESRIGFTEGGFGGCGGEFVAEDVMVVGERVLSFWIRAISGPLRLVGGGETVNRRDASPFVVG